MNEFQTPPGSSWRALPRFSLVGISSLLLAGVFSAVALGVTWVEFEVSGGGPGTFGFGGGEMRFGGGYDAFTFRFAGEQEPYRSAELDDADGIGLLRTGGPLLALGMSLAFVGLVLVTLDLFVPRRMLDVAGAGAAGLAFLTLLAGIITLSMGISRSTDGSFGGSASVTWGVGFFLALLAGVLALVGTGSVLAQRLGVGTDA